MTTLSLAMIVKNESACLEHCLTSVRALVDELVVVDTGSQDETVALARSFGAKVSSFPWRDDFAAARNESLRHCRGDWVLILDADEAVDALDHAILRKACDNPRASAYHLTLRNYHRSSQYFVRDAMAQENRSAYQEGREYPYYVDAQGLRLCRRLPGLAFTGRIHELLDPYFEARALPMASLPAVIHHYGKLQETREQTKARNYLAWALEERAQDPTNLQAHFNVVQQALVLEDWASLLPSSTFFMEQGHPMPSVVTYAHGLALQKTGRLQEAAACFRNLLHQQPGHVQGWMQLGLNQAAQDDPAAARRAFLRALELEPRYTQPYLHLAQLLFKQGHVQEGRTLLCQGLACCPLDPLLLNGLVLFDLWNQDVPQAMADARTALERCPEGGGGLWHHLVALSHLQANEPALARSWLARGLAHFPDNPDLLRFRDRFSA